MRKIQKSTKSKRSTHAKKERKRKAGRSAHMKNIRNLTKNNGTVHGHAELYMVVGWY